MRLAKSGDGELIQRIIHRKFYGFVHSTFNRTLNIQCLESGSLYTIACKGIDNAPNTLVIDLDRFEDVDIAVNDIVSSEHSIVSIANKMSITVDGAMEWNCVLPIYPSEVDVLEKNLFIMKRYINNHGKNSGIERVYTSDSPFDFEMSKMLHERTQLLISELQNKRMSTAIKYATSLIGLGPGLTPAGDDFLVGLFTVFNIKDSPYVSYQSFREEVVSQAKSLTNDISYAALEKAAVGKVRESISDLMSDLFRSNEEGLIGSLRKVLAIGSSSGTDIALGIVAGLEINMKIGGRV
ncbi:oxamate carbamoyltransferase subunit AllH family protein [Paenibacillus sp. CMAA1364]